MLFEVVGDLRNQTLGQLHQQSVFAASITERWMLSGVQELRIVPDGRSVDPDAVHRDFEMGSSWIRSRSIEICSGSGASLELAVRTSRSNLPIRLSSFPGGARDDAFREATCRRSVGRARA